MAVVAVIALLAPIGGAQLYRTRQLEIKVMNGLSDDMTELKTEMKAVEGELTRLRILVVTLLEGRGG
jgi:hypothetical protein